MDHTALPYTAIAVIFFRGGILSLEHGQVGGSPLPDNLYETKLGLLYIFPSVNTALIEAEDLQR